MNTLIFEHWTIATPYALLIGLFAGAILGVIHFQTLKWNTGLYVEGGVGKAIALHVLRFVLLIVVFALLAKLGALALLSGMAGLLVARVFIVRRERQAE